MAVIRVKKSDNYTVMSNYHLRDKDLSLKAKGLMSFMLSLPDDWDYTVEGLVRLVKEGRDTVRAALHELEEHGYLVRVQTRDSHGRMSSAEYTLQEKPSTDKPSVEKPISDKPMSETPVSENPTSVKPTQLNTNIPSTKGTNLLRSTKETKRPLKFEPPTVEEVKAYEAEKGYHFDAEEFVAFYASKGWMIGKNRMKDWHAACLTWHKRERARPTGKPGKEKPKIHIPDYFELMAEKERREKENGRASEAGTSPVYGSGYRGSTFGGK